MKALLLSLSVVSAIATSSFAGQFPKKMKEMIKEQMEWKLADPYSAKYTFDIYGGPTPTGAYLACGTVNAKNQFGAYTGRQMYFAIVDKSGKLNVTMVSAMLVDNYLKMCRDFQK
jgi:hypothetical protein